MYIMDSKRRKGMLTQNLTRILVGLILVPGFALELTFLFRRYGKAVQPWFVAAFLLPLVPLSGYMFQSDPRIHVVYLSLYVLGDVMRAVIPVPLTAKILGRKPPVPYSAALYVLGAALILLAPFEIVQRSVLVVLYRNAIRYLITWTVCGYLLAQWRFLAPGIPRVSVLLFSVTSFLNLPFIVLGRAAANALGVLTTFSFFSYDQNVVNGFISYALFNLVIGVLFIAIRPKPALSAVRDGVFDPAALLDLLSRREKEIAALLCRGWSYQKIADRLFISRNTVRNHCHTIFEKCKVNSRYELNYFLGPHLETEEKPQAVDK
jgi:DNA-binding CsgD family transcriptional regulator